MLLLVIKNVRKRKKTKCYKKNVRKCKKRNVSAQRKTVCAVFIYLFVFADSVTKTVGVCAPPPHLPLGEAKLVTRHFLVLQVVVRGIVEWLLLSGLSEKVRTDLYASLLYYLQLCRRPKSSPYKGTRTPRFDVPCVRKGWFGCPYSHQQRLYFRLVCVAWLICNFFK